MPRRKPSNSGRMALTGYSLCSSSGPGTIPLMCDRTSNIQVPRQSRFSPVFPACTVVTHIRRGWPILGLYPSSSFKYCRQEHDPSPADTSSAGISERGAIRVLHNKGIAQILLTVDTSVRRYGYMGILFCGYVGIATKVEQVGE